MTDTFTTKQDACKLIVLYTDDNQESHDVTKTYDISHIFVPALRVGCESKPYNNFYRCELLDIRDLTNGNVPYGGAVVKQGPSSLYYLMFTKGFDIALSDMGVLAKEMTQIGRKYQNAEKYSFAVRQFYGGRGVNYKKLLWVDLVPCGELLVALKARYDTKTFSVVANFISPDRCTTIGHNWLMSLFSPKSLRVDVLKKIQSNRFVFVGKRTNQSILDQLSSINSDDKTTLSKVIYKSNLDACALNYQWACIVCETCNWFGVAHCAKCRARVPPLHVLLHLHEFQTHSDDVPLRKLWSAQDILNMYTHRQAMVAGDLIDNCYSKKMRQDPFYLALYVDDRRQGDGAYTVWGKTASDMYLCVTAHILPLLQENAGSNFDIVFKSDAFTERIPLAWSSWELHPLWEYEIHVFTQPQEQKTWNPYKDLAEASQLRQEKDFFTYVECLLANTPGSEFSTCPHCGKTYPHLSIDICASCRKSVLNSGVKSLLAVNYKTLGDVLGLHERPLPTPTAPPIDFMQPDTATTRGPETPPGSSDDAFMQEIQDTNTRVLEGCESIELNINRWNYAAARETFDTIRILKARVSSAYEGSSKSQKVTTAYQHIMRTIESCLSKENKGDIVTIKLKFDGDDKGRRSIPSAFLSSQSEFKGILAHAIHAICIKDNQVDDGTWFTKDEINQGTDDNPLLITIITSSYVAQNINQKMPYGVHITNMSKTVCHGTLVVAHQPTQQEAVRKIYGDSAHAVSAEENYEKLLIPFKVNTIDVVKVFTGVLIDHAVPPAPAATEP